MLKRAMGYDADGLSCALCGLSPDRLSRGQDGPSAGRGRVHACVCASWAKAGRRGPSISRTDRLSRGQDGPSAGRTARPWSGRTRCWCLSPSLPPSLSPSLPDRQAVVRTDQVLVLMKHQDL